MIATILKHLRANGEQLDAEISQALNIPMLSLIHIYSWTGVDCNRA